MKPKCSHKRTNPVNTSTIGVDAKRTSDASLKDNEKTAHVETMLPHQDPQCRKEELTLALAIIKKVMSMEAAEPFNVPVNPSMLGITDYFDVINTPMDFGTIRHNLEKGVKYMNADDVFSDVQYIWENCYKYNKPGDPILELVKQVEETFIMSWNAVGLYSTDPRVATGPPSRQKQTKGQVSSSSRKRKRGPTCYNRLLRLKPGERIIPQWNENGEVIQQERGRQLTSYMGMLVRCQRNAPLQVKDWSQVPDEAKEKLWVLLLEKFDIGDEHKDYVMSSMRSKYRNYRSMLKAKYYDPYRTDEEQLSNCPPDVSQDDWRWLVQYWGTPEAKAVSERNKASRSKHVMKHTSGSKSHAQIRYEQAQMMKDGKEPSQLEMSVLTHTRKDGTPVDNASRDIMTKLEELSSQQAERAPPDVDELYAQVMRRHGHVRKIVLGPTQSRESARALVKVFENVKEQLASMNKQHEKVRKELEEMALQKQQMQEEMQEWMEEQLMKMKDEMMQEFEQYMRQFQQRLRLTKIQ